MECKPLTCTVPVACGCFGSILSLVQFGIFPLFCLHVYYSTCSIMIHYHIPEQRKIYTKLDHGQG